MVKVAGGFNPERAKNDRRPWGERLGQFREE